ncbi:uncharacterized protein HD556DRAFT_1479703 [Suillus plorans]|uniref:Uncharacterized protein n=1 Tax=Suillus plorans TaxID=116603 RepID=A0A9P7DHN2_9AGAM|nr:uncharacterized protein HD556DRAFT_1479703 [Suillus plorans]KAG1793100.1 hypothetical protein HD556DRAFT_1479703 [Suillus plorans]
MFVHRTQPKFSLLASQACHQFYHGGLPARLFTVCDEPSRSPVLGQFGMVSSLRYQNDGGNGFTLLVDSSSLPLASKPLRITSRFSRLLTVKKSFKVATQALTVEWNDSEYEKTKLALCLVDHDDTRRLYSSSIGADSPMLLLSTTPHVERIKSMDSYMYKPTPAVAEQMGVFLWWISLLSHLLQWSREVLDVVPDSQCGCINKVENMQTMLSGKRSASKVEGENKERRVTVTDRCGRQRNGCWASGVTRMTQSSSSDCGRTKDSAAGTSIGAVGKNTVSRLSSTISGISPQGSSATEIGFRIECDHNVQSFTCTAASGPFANSSLRYIGKPLRHRAAINGRDVRLEFEMIYKVSSPMGHGHQTFSSLQHAVVPT